VTVHDEEVKEAFDNFFNIDTITDFAVCQLAEVRNERTRVFNDDMSHPNPYD
jgi:hypothetical protein